MSRLLIEIDQEVLQNSNIDIKDYVVYGELSGINHAEMRAQYATMKQLERDLREARKKFDELWNDRKDT